jgi:protein TonB
MTASMAGSAGEFQTLIGESAGLYRSEPSSFVIGFLSQAVAVGFLIAMAGYAGHSPELRQPVTRKIRDLATLSFLATPGKPGGHGSGGDQGPLAPSKGGLPEMSMRLQLAPPAVQPRNPDPKLPEPPSLMALSEVKFPQFPNLGDPLAAVAAPPSNGPGNGGGIGTVCCGGVGSSPGSGFGDAPGGNVFRAGFAGVSEPRVIYDPDPEYTDEARNARFEGVVLLALLVDAEGHTSNIRVQRSLGMGLDQKAVQTVGKWRFQPATWNGHAVAVLIHVEVSFKLY